MESVKVTERKSKTIQRTKVDEMSLNSIFEYCLDLMRKEHLIGDDALRELAYLITLRLLEPRFGNQIDIDNYEYPFTLEEINPTLKTTLLGLVRFSQLVKYAKEKEDNLIHMMKILWTEILTVHPKTKNIFMKDSGFQLSNQKTVRNILEKLASFPFETIKDDILGEAYEEVIQHVMTGRTLGQHFTPTNIKKMMIQLIEPKLFENGQTETMFDPAMGTGGFLISYLRFILHESLVKNIPLDYDFLTHHGIGGREAHTDTFQLAVSNMLISSGCIFETLEKGDSIKNPIRNKYDVVLANPPFGIKGIDYLSLDENYVPIQTNNAVSLFLQLIIYILKVNGRCAVVMPKGKDITSDKPEFVLIRKFLMKTCDLKEVISFPKNLKVFSHTNIETCVFYFVKKMEGSSVLEVTKEDQGSGKG
jgi:type I restriction-modification system DNA methylase subunit